MAFHVACPITCRRICFCTLGFPQKLQSEKGRKNFLEEVFRVEEFLSDPWSLTARQKGTVQVSVPRIVAPTPVVTTVADGFGGGDGDGEEILSAHTKRAAMQKKANAASLAAEDYARRFETGRLSDASGEIIRDFDGEDKDSSTINVMCRICLHGENEGGERAKRMLACKMCNKKYHRNCLKSWAQHRDLFHWSSWACPSCRICEVCRRPGDPNKFMFCKRCDGAYHCYCQQPPHKNITPGPYLCPKHTRCHSCGSNVPGSGPTTRWFLGYTCCDACGRLFVKGNYCPVCLKVYRDSESTPMVCCDACQRWVHCDCDDISDEKYLQFQADRNLYYKCAACRGDCYQVNDLDDAVQELWRRRDKADQDQIASLRAAAGLPSQEEIFSISPYSDDEENSPIILKNEYGRSLKLSVKGFVDKAPKYSKEYGKKYSNKKSVKKKGYKASLIGKTEAHQNFEMQNDVQFFEYNLDDGRNGHRWSHRSGGSDITMSPVAGVSVNTKEKCSVNQPGNINRNSIEEGVVNNKDRASRVLQIKSSKSHGLDVLEGTGKRASKTESAKGTKLVIHLGAKNRNVTNSPSSETSSCHREQDLTAINGEKLDNPNQFKGSKYKGRECNLIKLGKVKSDISDLNPSIGRGNITEGYESTAMERNRDSLGNRSTEVRDAMVKPVTETITSRDDEVLLKKQTKGTPSIRDESYNNMTVTPSVSDLLPKDHKPLLKLKFKNPSLENRSSWVPQGEEELSSVKGQRSKRKRPSPLIEKASVREDEDDTEFHRNNPSSEVMDANWILKKLGKDAMGKKVEVHQPSNNSWHRGVVTDVVEGTSALTVHLDDGRDKTLDLRKHGVRFVTHKQKRSKA